MNILNPKKRRKLFMLSIVVLTVVFIAIAKFGTLFQNSGWIDIYDTSSETIAPTMNSNQLEASLEDVLKQYEGLMNSSNQLNKHKMVSELDKLYQLSVNDDTDANALENSSNKNQTLDDLTQSATLLTLSIFEIKDSLNNDGNFSTTQLRKSKQDLASAIGGIERVRQELKS